MKTSGVIAGFVSLVVMFTLVSSVMTWATRPAPTAETQSQRSDPNELEKLMRERREAELEADAEAEAEAIAAAEAEAEDPSSPNAEVHESNPFELTTEGPLPKSVVDETIHEFDRLAVGATGKHTFEIRNEGDAPLMLAKGKSTCKCTGFTVGLKEVAPGESAEIELAWVPKSELLDFVQMATVWTNDPDQPKVELRVEGAVVPLISTIPKGTWAFGTISEGSPSVVHGVIAAYLADSFEIESIEASSEHITVDYEPLPPEEAKKMHALSGYKLTCTISPEVPVGTFLEKIKVNTSLEEAPQVQFTLAGNRVGPFQVIGPGWVQAKQMLQLGRFKAAEGKQTHISFFVAVPDGLEFAFDEAQVTPPLLNVSVERDESFGATNGRERHVIQIEAPPGTTPGRWNDENPIKVVIPCNHPYTDHASFFVEMQAD